MFTPGTNIQVVKLSPDGTEATRYRAEVLDEPVPSPWIAVRAEWAFKRVESHGLVFEPGDSLVEYFSPEHWFDAFRVEAPDGSIRGWYGNVAYPAVLTTEPEPTLTWHDLYLDVIALPDRTVQLCDEDELAESKLLDRDPLLHQLIVETASRMIGLAETSTFPFHQEVDQHT